MTFKLTAEPFRYWWPVEVKVPSAQDVKDAGKVETQALKVLLEPLGQDEAKELDRELAELPEQERNERQHDHIERVVKGWDNVVGEDGGAVPFSLQAFRQAMQRSWFRMAIYKAYTASLAAGIDAAT